MDFPIVFVTWIVLMALGGLGASKGLFLMVSKIKLQVSFYFRGCWFWVVAHPGAIVHVC